MPEFAHTSVKIQTQLYKYAITNIVAYVGHIFRQAFNSFKQSVIKVFYILKSRLLMEIYPKSRLTYPYIVLVTAQRI